MAHDTHQKINFDEPSVCFEYEDDDCLEQYEKSVQEYEQKMAKLKQLKQQLHKDIDNMLAKIPVILVDESKLVSARIVEVMGLYQKADRWASNTDYDKEKHRELLVEYAKFLTKYGFNSDAEVVLLRISIYFNIEDSK